MPCAGSGDTGRGRVELEKLEGVGDKGNEFMLSLKCSWNLTVEMLVGS